MNKINEKIDRSENLKEYISSISGIGYLIQSLYLTDDSIRKNSILTALTIVVKAYEVTKKLSSDGNIKLFQRFSVPILALLNMFLFYDNFNSISVKEPLKLSFNELFDKYKELEQKGDTNKLNNLGFKLLLVAQTLSTKNINDVGLVEKLMFETSLLEDPFFELLFEFGTEVIANSDLRTIKEELKKAKQGT